MEAEKMGQGESGSDGGGDAQGADAPEASSGMNFDNMDRRFCIRNRHERDEQMSRVDPESDGLLRRIDQQLGSLT
jgi:hypothetical protein